MTRSRTTVREAQITREIDDGGDGDTSETLTWDVSSNLVKSVVADGTDTTTWLYLYDAGGQRWAKIEQPTTTGSPTPRPSTWVIRDH